jgi:tartrate-resistant acid phosphatase type 5
LWQNNILGASIVRYLLGITTIALALTAQPFACAAEIRFAVIGDQGDDSVNQLAVANRVKAFAPDFITTTGDNTYLVGTTPAADFANWDTTQGKYYADYIKLPPGSAYGPGATVNNYFPILGNHDWDEGVASYSNYFTLPEANATSGERYYSFQRGSVEFFMLDADSRESGAGFDGRSIGTTQYEWAKNAITNSTASWQIVMFHQPAYSYATSHAPSTTMRWAFQSWGVDAIFSGHNHNMQDLTINDPATGNVGLPYFVQGASGKTGLYRITGAPALATGNWSNDSSYGFSLVTADETSARVEFYDAGGSLLRSRNLSQIAATSVPEPSALPLMLGGTAVAIGLRRRLKRQLAVN